MIKISQLNYSWAILASACVILFFNSGSRMAFGIMLKPMQEELGWSRSSLSLAPTVFMFVSSITMPIAGRFTDRYGFQRILAFGVLVSALGLSMVGWVDSRWHLFLLYGVMFAIGSAASSLGLLSVLVSRWFIRGRGRANSIATSGGAVGQLVVISLLSAFLVDWGWRWSYRILGISLVATTLPLVLLVVRSSPTASRSEEGISASPSMPSPEGLAVYPLNTLLKSRSFLLLALLYAICGFQDWLVGTHVVAFATDQGVSSVVAGNLLALMGVMGMVGVLMSGYLSDAFGPAWPSMVCFFLRIAIFSLVLGSDSSPAIVIFALLYGFTFLITAPLTPIFAARFFGSQQLGAITGSISMAHQMAGGLGALVGGIVFDAFGDYSWAWVLALGLSLLGTVTALLLQGQRAPQTA